jgi:hypothetical protein
LSVVGPIHMNVPRVFPPLRGQGRGGEESPARADIAAQAGSGNAF